MFQNDLNKDLQQSYYSSYFKDSSFSHDFSYKSPKKFDSSPAFQKSSLSFTKCAKHPMFDLIMICTEKKCNFSPAICKICLTDTHLDHKYMNLIDFLSLMKEKLMKSEKKKELKFQKIKEDINGVIEGLCIEYSSIITKMKSFIDNVQAKLKTDFKFFWNSLQEYPPFKFMNIINKIENNSINTIRVLNSSLNFLLDYDNQEKKIKNGEIEYEIEENFNSILQNMKFNEEKLKESRQKIEDIINSINLDKIPLFHSNYIPKNESMVFFA